MADDAASFTLSLVDHISGPAKNASSALGGTESALKSVGSASSAAAPSMESAANAATAVAAAALAVGAAIVGAVIGLAEMALAAHDAQDAQQDLAESMYGVGAAADAAVAATYEVSAASGLAQKDVFALGEALMRAGVSSAIYGETLQAMADISSVAGEKALKSIQKVINKTEQLGTFKIGETDLKGSGLKMSEVYEQLASDLGISVDKVKQEIAAGKIAAETGIKAIDEVAHKKFGGAAAGNALDFGAQIMKAKENVLNLFKDVNVQPFLDALHKVLSLVDSNTASGKALKEVLTGAMNAFFKAAAATIPYVEAFLLGVAIGALDIYIALKPAIHSVEKLLGVKNDKTANGLKTAAAAGKTFAAAIVVGGAAVVVVFGAIAAAVAAPIAAWHKMNSAAQSVGKTIGNAFKKAYHFLSTLDWAGVADALIEGIVQGIKNGAAKVIGAVKDLAANTVKTAKASFGIASPSKVFREIGLYNAEGLSQGHAAGASGVAKSIQHMTAIPASSARPANSNGGGRGITVAEGAVVIHIHGADSKSAPTIAAEVRREILNVWEELATGTGGRG